MLNQAKLYTLLQAHDVFEKLVSFDPQWVGSAALDVHIEGSDLDICCDAGTDLNGFEAALKSAFGKYPGFKSKQEIFGGEPSCVCWFKMDDIPVNIWGRAHPVERHEFYRYYKVQQSFLRLGGEALQGAIRDAKEDGLKTEAAFGVVLDLKGDPETALLDLYDTDAMTYMQLLKQAGFL